VAQKSPELVEAMSALIARQPFFAVYMLDMLEVVETDTVPTAGTDSVKIFINPTFFKEQLYNTKERMFVLCHEILHGILQHPERMRMYMERGQGPDGKEWNPQKFNYAADYVINDALIDAKIGSMPTSGGLHDKRYTKDDSVDEVYTRLPDEPGGKGGGRNGNGSGTFDTHMPAGDKAPSKAAVQRALKSAEAAAKAQGNMPAGLQRIVDEFCEPQVRWQDILRKTIVAKAGKDTMTWNRPNRRKLAVAPHIYWPGRTGHMLHPMAVEIDTSGSIGDHELKTFMGELAGIVSDCSPEKLYVMYVDAAVHEEIHEVTDYSDLQNVARRAGGGGSTDMTVIFREVEDKQLAVGTAIIFTDGYTPFGEDPGYEVIWCITSKGITAPFGTSIHIDIRGR
jgi:predicted metal-dependent peptidase